MRWRLTIAVLLAFTSPALAQPNSDDICEVAPSNTPKDVLAFQQRRITCSYMKDGGNPMPANLRCGEIKHDEAKLRQRHVKNAAALKYLRETAGCLP